MHENVCTASDRINPSKIVFFFFFYRLRKRAICFLRLMQNCW